MEEKKKFALSAVWNQMDKAPVKNQAQSSNSTTSKTKLKLSKSSEKNMKLNVFEPSADQDPIEVTVLKNNIDKNYEFLESSKTTHSRSGVSKRQIDLKNKSMDHDLHYRQHDSQKSSAHSKSSRHDRNEGNQHASNTNTKKRYHSSKNFQESSSVQQRTHVLQSSKANHSRSSAHTKSIDNYRSEDNLHAGNTDNKKRFNTSKNVHDSSSIQQRNHALQPSQANYSRFSSTQAKDIDNIYPKKIHSKSQACNSKNSNEINFEVKEHEYKFPAKHNKRGPLSFTGLKELVNKEPDEILITICPKHCAFQILIAEKNIRTDMMALALIAIGKACTSGYKQTLYTFLNTIQGNNEFHLLSIQKYLVSLRQNSIKDYHLESLAYLAVFLQKVQHTLPSSSSDLISMLLPLLLSKCESFLKYHDSYSDVLGKLREIEEQNEYFINQLTHADTKASNKRTQLMVEPPENFRSLPVLPNIDDIHSEAYLRPNVVEGKYVDVEHYLDVQYRLLREDYVKPLRDGIGEYLRLKEAGKSLKNCRDVRVYENVHIVKQDFVNGSMLHIAQLTGDNILRIKWEYSKRFLTGSLLCLSSDDFKSMFFASVARRIPEQLKKGLLLIRFEEISDEVLNISPLRSFVIIETSAYFEAYRYNLKALHESNGDVLPLKRYIVDVERNVNHPHYLKPYTTYDMRPLLIPINSTNVKCSETINGDIDFKYEYPADISTLNKSVEVLNDSSWPSASDLNLDNSQYLALKEAVTKEFAIIQGPPGTGKTYIGLRIVQLLLHNIDKWLMREINSLPILVVCFTNHALDQFLEGMTCFTDKIVRIGGRGTNEAVSRFQLNNLKRSSIQKKEIPSYIHTGLWLQNQELKSLKLEIDKASYLVQKSIKNVLGEKDLKTYIPDFQYYSLKNVINFPEFKQFNLNDDDLIIHDWLGVRSRFEWGNFEISNEIDENKSQVVDSKPVHVENDDMDEGSSNEADVEFIEAQRDIDTDNFADVSFDIEDPEKELPSTNDFGWQYQGGRKQRFKFIKNWLNNSKPLEESEALKINNVWNLDLLTKWSLYKFWLQKMIDEKQKECIVLQEKLKSQYQQLCDMRTEEDIYILRKAHVVGMTTTGAAKYRDIVQRLNPQILIVEEAAEILESHIVTSLAPNTQHVILIGDHQQLQPSPTVYMLAVKYNLNISLFERMIKNKMDCYRLSMQHRMRPDIAALIVPHIYKDLKNHESVSKYENIRGVSKNVFFICHDYNELQENDSKSKSNEHEAKFLIKLCRYFIQQGYDSSEITVLTTYSGQLFMMKKMAKTNAIIQNVRFTVVDNYQGEENDIILISFVRSNEDGEIGFLKVANRVCVALSRAKKGLFCIGNFELLAEKSNVWKNITGTLRRQKAIGPSLQLLCQNHPEVHSMVTNAKDFESVPEGGCTKPCSYRLSCGHVCSLMCHPYDSSHENVRCSKQCNKTCKEGHECPKKCYEDCGPCKHPVSKTIFTCGHIVEVPCDSQHLKLICSAKCDKTLNCGHKCTNNCSEACSELCKEMISIKSPVCNHEVTVQCRYKNSPEELIINCRQPCKSTLDCGHKCKGNCFRCHQGRLHIACNQPCKRVLVCGHECKAPCAKSCPPCRLPCENKCVHSKCPKKCGEPCDMCTEKCNWRCEHKACSNLCGEICNRVPCHEPCHQPLECGHPCIGFCGEPCPAECRMCNSEVVKEIFFGTEEEDNARFVQLEDCNHILEISGLNAWMMVENEGNHQIQMKACPKCKTVIRTNLRFGNVVKNCLKKIESVKQKTFGDKENNMRLKNRLLSNVNANSQLLKSLRSDSFSLYDSWKKILTSERSRSIQEITTMDNIVRISLELAAARLSVTSFNNQVSVVRKDLSVLVSFVKASEPWLLYFMLNEVFTASEQQLKQLSLEVHRLKLSYKLLNLALRSVINVPNSDFEKCITILTNNFAFGENDIAIFCASFSILAKNCGSAIINISEMEKRSILKAMNLSTGHWYQCPNGHVYCITECGGATVKSKCSECNAEIGGTDHRLLATNRVATAMDGARHSAWSDEMNLGNYDLQFND